MADIELIVKLPEEVYKQLVKYGKPLPRGNSLDDTIMKAVADGTPLPEGHGRLIDADAFITTMEDASKRQNYKELLIDDILTVDDVFKAIIESLKNKGLAEGNSPTIIEADKAERELFKEV